MIPALMTRYYDTLRLLGQGMRTLGRAIEGGAEKRRDVWSKALERYRGQH